MPNYSFVIDSSFKPFSFEEMLRPWAMYSAASEKVEEAYDEINRKANLFSYLEDTLKNNPEDRAAQIYKNYMDEFNKQEQDFAKNGLSISNRRGLLGLKRRFQGEIGQLEQADVQLKELQKQRNALSAAGKQILYGNDTPTLSDLLPGNTSFNRYAIDTADIRARGNALGKAMSSRIYDNTEEGKILHNQYALWKSTHGPKDIAGFMNSDAVQNIVAQELIANGAAENLSGRNLEAARLNLLNGIYEGIVYEESVKPLENGEYMSAAERARLEESKRQYNMNLRIQGIDPDTGEYHPEKSIAVQKARAIQEAKNAGKVVGGSGTAYDARNKETIMVGATTGQEYKYKDDEKSIIGKPLEDLSKARRATAQDIQRAKTSDAVMQAIGGAGNINDYEILVIPANSTKIDGSGFFWDDSNNEDIYIIKPRESKRAATDSTDGISFNSGATNDIGD